MDALRWAAWRSARDRIAGEHREAARVLGDILAASGAKPRDRIAAARVVLGAAGPLFAKEGNADAVEDRGLPPVTGSRDWSALMLETARRAGELAGNQYHFQKTPGAAWVESGLADAFPDSFDQLRALAGKMDDAETYCHELIARWQDALDCEALSETEEETAEG